MTRETAVLICLFCLILQSMVWFVTDPRNHQKRLKEFLHHKRLRVYGQAVVFMLLYLPASFFLTWPDSPKNSAWVSFGVLIYLTGTFFAIWAKFAMNKYWGIPAQHDNERQTLLITEGPFSYSRNPIYLGGLLLFFGFSIAMRSYSILLVPVVFYAMHKTILVEEELLLKKFGKEYEKYKTKVARFI